MKRRLVAGALACALIGWISQPLGAQGHHGVPPGQAKKLTKPTSGAPSSSSPAPAPAPDGVPLGPAGVSPRVLGSWLDDATPLEAGSTWMTISTSRWGSPAGTGYDSPILDVTTAFMPRVQVGLTLPYARFSDGTGSSWSGLGDVYFTAKVVVRDVKKGVRVAVAPTLEWSTSASAFELAVDRTHWIFPVNVELAGRDGWRTYASGGYFTRGALFAAGALERTLTEHLTVTGALTQSFSTSAAESAETYGLSRRRTDASGGAAYTVSPSLMLFASVSRTLSRMDYDGSRYAVSGGVSVNLVRR